MPDKRLYCLEEERKKLRGKLTATSMAYCALAESDISKVQSRRRKT
jgi:hypothetical protein